MDNGLVLKIMSQITVGRDGLNPCCSGQWSRTAYDKTKTTDDSVLILVVVDNGLVHLLIITFVS